ncbi:hypothetical protein [Frigoriglobus tundricola]|uniref:Uncharacterized protein n=1 Tax=Frigoriglobus tundricola TaxID=2774151 RepID=A0A6M5YN35_9BACT|nr:hypothetical protein [Frigoriglobus tundricola]QJW94780.1 hypothetical protein FTUN_2303 [Frigoriglobus tundricola]
MPRRWRLTDDGDAVVRTLATTPGDLFVLHSRGDWVPPDEPSPAGVLRAVQNEPCTEAPFAAVLCEVL